MSVLDPALHRNDLKHEVYSDLFNLVPHIDSVSFNRKSRKLQINVVSSLSKCNSDLYYQFRAFQALKIQMPNLKFEQVNIEIRRGTTCWN